MVSLISFSIMCNFTVFRISSSFDKIKLAGGPFLNTCSVPSDFEDSKTDRDKAAEVFLALNPLD